MTVAHRRKAGRGRPPREQYEALLKEQCEIWDVDFAKTLSGNKSRPFYFVRARVFNAFLLQGYSLPGIGHVCGLHHTSVLWATRRVAAMEAWMVAWREGLVTHRCSPKRLARKPEPRRARVMAGPPPCPVVHGYRLQVSKAQMMGARA